MSSSPAMVVPHLAPRLEVRCECGFAVFDGEVLRARVVRLLPRGAEAKCRCKRWVPVPVAYVPG